MNHETVPVFLNFVFAGKWLYCVGEDGVLYIFDARSGQLENVLQVSFCLQWIILWIILFLRIFFAELSCNTRRIPHSSSKVLLAKF